MKDETSSKHKRRFSLSLKLNLLITAIVVITSAVLIKISYDSYTKTAYLPIQKRMETCAQQLKSVAPLWVPDAILAYTLTGYDGFEEAHAVAVEKPWHGMNDWLAQFRVNFMGDRIIPESEYQALRSRLEAEGREQGVAEEALYGWICEQEPLIREFMSSADSKYTELGNLISMSVSMGSERIQVYVEDADGFVEIMDCIDSTLPKYTSEKDSVAPWTFEPYGTRLQQVEAIAHYRQLTEKSAFQFDLDDGPYLVNVYEPESQGMRVYAVYACDITEVRNGQRSFLIRNLILAGLLELAAIALSLLILRRAATSPLLNLAKAATAFAADDNALRSEDVVDLNLRANDEIGDLYREIRSMQTRIIDSTKYITRMTAEKERIATELTLASQIQANMLPNHFPAFPERSEFDVFASMTPAKAVGGDFYDFFLIDEDHLALVMADVSGKGIPAALFMMISKIVLQNIAMSGLSPAAILENANRQILANNNEDMFVTVWLGILELSTGRLTAANAGHEYPMLKDPDGGFRLYKDPHGFVLGSLPDRKYRDYTLQLEPGSSIFVYTDGVPEASDENGGFFGFDRTLEALNECQNETPEAILRKVREAVDAFVNGAEQFDDLTMLCVEYRGKQTDGSAQGSR